MLLSKRLITLNMVFTLFVVLFLIKLRFPKSRPISDIITKRYGRTALKIFRSLQNTLYKKAKCELDHKFLITCKSYNVKPKFLNFKLYRNGLRKSKTYQNFQSKLLNMEINDKSKQLTLLDNKLADIEKKFNETFSYLDTICIKYFLKNHVTKFINKTQDIHKKKLLHLGIKNTLSPITPEKVLFNYSDVDLSQREKFILSLGLDFSLPVFDLDHNKYFLKFEKFAYQIKNLSTQSTDFSTVKSFIKQVAYKYFYKFNPYKIFHPFFHKEDMKIIKKLSKNKSLIICKPDKGRGIVLLNKNDYIQKMTDIINDRSKFKLINEDELKLTIKLEDKIRKFINKLNDVKKEKISHCKPTGSTPGILYGLPKIHKSNIPLRPILAAYNTPFYKLAKWLVNALSDLTSNEYTLKNTYDLCHQVSHLKNCNNMYFASFDIESLFTNIPLEETIEIIMNLLFPQEDSTYEDFNKTEFEEMLRLATQHTYFFFNESLHQQIDGISMGSPLGPTFANIFVNSLEKKFLDLCPLEYKPIFYRRFMDDTLVAFHSPDHIELFLNYINRQHINIKFTVEKENNNSLPFLDTIIKKQNDSIKLSVYRKPTYTPLGINFFSYIPILFKINAIKTLLYRAYSVCSDYITMHDEFNFIKNFFLNNGFPESLIDSIIKKFLNKMLTKEKRKPTVEKLKVYISLPYFGYNSEKMKEELFKKLTSFYKYADFKIILTNDKKIGSFFNFKDKLPRRLRSSIIYSYKCASCKTAQYIGCTSRCFQIRIDEHKGVSSRTGNHLTSPSYSAIREHADIHGKLPSSEEFEILDIAKTECDLKILESLYIKKLNPNLNNLTSSIPLLIT